jgi:hypothetical protein
MEEGSEVALPSQKMELLLNRPVRFRLFSSVLREGDQPGDVLRIEPSELHELPPLYTVLRHPRSSQQRPVTVTLTARLSEIGTLELWAAGAEPVEGDPESGGGTPLKWRLQFDLRQSEGSSPAPSQSQSGGDGEEVAALPTEQAGLVAAASEHIRSVFAGAAPAAGLPKALSQVLGPRDGWATATLRALWESLVAARDKRTRGAAHEARWLNLAGFCLRPGFGYALDDWRVKEAWRVFNAGLTHEKDDTCRLEWWILWRRIAGGLSRNQQEEIWKRAAPLVIPSLKRPDRKPCQPQRDGGGVSGPGGVRAARAEAQDRAGRHLARAARKAAKRVWTVVDGPRGRADAAVWSDRCGGVAEPGREVDGAAGADRCGVGRSALPAGPCRDRAGPAERRSGARLAAGDAAEGRRLADGAAAERRRDAARADGARSGPA